VADTEGLCGLYKRLGPAAEDCRFAESACVDGKEACIFKMANGNNSQVADCRNESEPMENDFQGQLCCEIHEICYDGVDNDGDDLVDCADPECHEGDGNDVLEPFPNDGANVCHTNTCPATLHVDLNGFWQFEETLLDNSENEQELSKVGSPNYTDYIRGSLGQAMWFDGTNDYLRRPGSTGFYEPLNPDEAVSVTAWISSENPSGNWQGVAAKQPDVYSLDVGNGRARFTVETSNGNNSVQSAAGSINQSQWHHLTGTYDGSTVKLYVDGDQATTLDLTGNIVDTSGDFEVGRDNGGYFDGRIDQVRVYSRALNDSEISSFTNSTCNNRERTVECVNSPELCDTNYSSATAQNYHCNYGQYDDPQNTNYENAPPGSQGTGICCPRDKDATYDDFAEEWKCGASNECGIGAGEDCEYNITANESAWFDSRSDGSSNNCNSQVPDLHEDDNETMMPEGSQACCYVPKDGKMGFWYKDGNVEIYG